MNRKIAVLLAAFAAALIGAFTAAAPAAADTSYISTPTLHTLVPGDIRSGGAYEYVDGALHIAVTDAGNTSNNKVQLAFPTPTTFLITELGTLDVTATGTGYPNGPGLNIWVDINGDSASDGTLVFEEVYGQDFWVPDTAANQPLKDLAPSNTGGNGSAYHGTLDAWLEVLPEGTTVVGVALNYGSGVPVSEWTVTSVTFAHTTFTFDLDEAQATATETTAATTPAPTSSELPKTGLSPFALRGVIIGSAAIVIGALVLVGLWLTRQRRDSRTH